MSKPLIITHSGAFQPDDVFAVATLDLLLEGEYELIRSRDMEVIKTGDYVVDVGDVYDPSINRFDHHQKGGAGVRENGIPYSSFGLVWKHFGEKISGSVDVANRLEEKLVLAIDADDNGLEYPIGENFKPYGIEKFIYSFIPTWKEDDGGLDKAFKEAVSFARRLLEREIIQAKDKIEARKFVEEAYRQAEDKRIIVIDKSYPTSDVLDSHKEVLFVVKPDRAKPVWKIGTVEKEKESFESRKLFPESWSAKRDKELEDETGVEGALFCHKSLFVAGAKTKEAAIKMALIAANS